MWKWALIYHSSEKQKVCGKYCMQLSVRNPLWLSPKLWIAILMRMGSLFCSSLYLQAAVEAELKAASFLWNEVSQKEASLYPLVTRSQGCKELQWDFYATIDNPFHSSSHSSVESVKTRAEWRNFSEAGFCEAEALPDSLFCLRSRDSDQLAAAGPQSCPLFGTSGSHQASAKFSLLFRRKASQRSTTGKEDCCGKGLCALKRHLLVLFSSSALVVRVLRLCPCFTEFGF